MMETGKNQNNLNELKTHTYTQKESNERVHDLVWYIVHFDSFEDSPTIILTKK